MNVKDRIKDQLSQHKIVLYMKGTAIFPQCGFSAKAVDILKEYLHADAATITEKDILYVNVLEDPEIREGIKEYGQWPTIPQLYVNGQLVGGSDIMTELHDSGELTEIIRA
jgi:monothiol glutaredoxin